jgi:hypothetical protein
MLRERRGLASETATSDPPAFFATIVFEIRHMVDLNFTFVLFLLSGLTCMSVFTYLRYITSTSTPRVLCATMASKQNSKLLLTSPKLCPTDIPDSAGLPSLHNITIDEASKGIEAGQFTSSDLVEAYLARIQESTDFNAVLQTNPNVLEDARKLDEELRTSGRRR